MSIAVAPGRLMSRVPPLLRETAFRRYWSAQSISLAGDQISSIALPLAAVLALHASPAEMGYLSALIWLPSLLFALHAGAWVDRRGHRRATMIAADLGRAALLASIPVCSALGVLTLTQLFAVAFAAGTLSIFFTVSDAGVFAALVPRDRYVEGNSLIYQSRALAAVAGPSVGGLLVEALTAPFALAADALSFLGSAFPPGAVDRRRERDAGLPVPAALAHAPLPADAAGGACVIRLSVCRAGGACARLPGCGAGEIEPAGWIVRGPVTVQSTAPGLPTARAPKPRGRDLKLGPFGTSHRNG